MTSIPAAARGPNLVPRDLWGKGGPPEEPAAIAERAAAASSIPGGPPTLGAAPAGGPVRAAPGNPVSLRPVARRARGLEIRLLRARGQARAPAVSVLTVLGGPFARRPAARPVLHGWAGAAAQAQALERHQQLHPRRAPRARSPCPLAGDWRAGRRGPAPRSGTQDPGPGPSADRGDAAERGHSAKGFAADHLGPASHHLAASSDSTGRLTLTLSYCTVLIDFLGQPGVCRRHAR